MVISIDLMYMLQSSGAESHVLSTRPFFHYSGSPSPHHDRLLLVRTPEQRSKGLSGRLITDHSSEPDKGLHWYPYLGVRVIRRDRGG